MATMIKYLSAQTPFHVHPLQETFTVRATRISANKAELSSVRKANLCAKKRERTKLPNHLYEKSENGTYHFSEFLRHPCGVEAVLSTKALQSYESLDSSLYRCKLPDVQLLNFKVALLAELRVTPTTQGCLVEMLSCKFEGPDLMERQYQHYTASMRSQVKWETLGTQSFLDVDARLDIVLEINAQPFVLLPTSAVEGPGNMVIQALLDKLVSLQLQQLLQDYENWVHQRRRQTLDLQSH